jgi:hypothetical protein
MNNPRPGRPPVSTGLPDGIVRMLAERLDALDKRLDELSDAWAEQGDRVTLLEARDRSRGSGQRALSDEAVTAMRFMEQHYPMKFTALIIAENTGLDNRSLSGSLRTLANRGLIAMISTEGRNALWQALPPEKRKGSTDA